MHSTGNSTLFSREIMNFGWELTETGKNFGWELTETEHNDAEQTIFRETSIFSDFQKKSHKNGYGWIIHLQMCTNVKIRP